MCECICRLPTKICVHVWVAYMAATHDEWKIQRAGSHTPNITCVQAVDSWPRHYHFVTPIPSYTFTIQMAFVFCDDCTSERFFNFLKRPAYNMLYTHSYIHTCMHINISMIRTHFHFLCRVCSNFIQKMVHVLSLCVCVMEKTDEIEKKKSPIWSIIINFLRQRKKKIRLQTKSLTTNKKKVKIICDANSWNNKITNIST